MYCSTGKGGKVKGGNNRDKKTVMVKLIIQRKKNHSKNHQVQENKMFSVLVKVLELFLRHPNLVLAYK
jgi:hypothetical protein